MLELRFADLFCGIGGFRLALERAGMQCVYANDNDRFACQIYRRHWDDGALDERDIREVRELPQVDLVCGGFPCQDVSTAGKRAGLGGERSGLFWEMMRLVEQAKPQTVLLENVPGLLSSGNGRDFALILRALDELGYDAIWRVLGSWEHGSPQARERLFIAAHPRGAAGLSVLDEPVKGAMVTDRLETPSGQWLPAEDEGAAAEVGVRPLWNAVHPQDRIRDADGIAASLLAADGSPEACTGWYFDGEHVRRLSPVECERLQGFPDRWTEGINDAQRYKCLGNAVCVPVVEWIAMRLCEVISNG